jgi:excisionase family DNA binding protein
VIFVGSENLRMHLAVAVRAHLRNLQRNGARAPQELLDLAAVLSGESRNAQMRSEFADSGRVGDADSGTTSATAPGLVPAATAARRLSVSLSTLRRWAADGRIEPVRIGRTVRYRVTDLDELTGRCEAG